MALTNTTRLEAVNTILENVGQSPVSTLEVSGFADVAIAKQILERVNRSVQNRGWYFNTEDDYSLALNGDNKIPIPPNALKCDPMSTESVDAVRRGDFLYDLENHTFTFSAAVKCRIVWYLEFEELPEAAREYITVAAARIFQKRGFGSSTLDSFTEEDELKAWTTLLEDEVEHADPNMFTGSWSVASALHRVEPWSWD
jgi:hypothetical protein